MTDADRQYPKDKIADGNQQHLGGEKPDADRQYPFGAITDGNEQHLGDEKPDADLQEPLGAKPDADQHEPASVQLDAEQQDFLAKLDAKWRDPIGAMAGADRQEPFGAITAGNEQHLGDEITDADRQEPNGEIADADRQYPFGAKPDADQHEPASVQLDAEQQDFLAKLDAKWRDPIGAMADADLREPLDKKPDADKEDPKDKIADADRQEPLGEKPDADQQHLGDEITDADRQYSFGAIADGYEQLLGVDITDADRQEPLGEKPDAEKQNPVVEPSPAVEPRPTVEPPKPKVGPILLIAAIGTGVGILLGIAIAAITWHEAKTTPPPEPNVAREPSLPHETKDLGTVASNTVGLQGHLITKWDDKLEYSLVIEPNDPAHLAGFALAVSDPPRPLSIVVELKNFAGFVLCRQNIVLKYDAGKAAALAAARAKNLAGKSHGSNISSDRDNQAADLDQLEAQEAERERGKDIFRNQTGPNGQIESIRSQGEIPCPAIAYGSVAYWSFTPNFPAVDEQDALLKRRANATSPSSKTPAARKGAK